MQLGALRRVVSQPNDILRRLLCRSRMHRVPLRCQRPWSGSVYESRVDLTTPGEDRRNDKVGDHRVLGIAFDTAAVVYRRKERPVWTSTSSGSILSIPKLR